MIIDLKMIGHNVETMFTNCVRETSKYQYSMLIAMQNDRCTQYCIPCIPSNLQDIYSFLYLTQ